MREKFSIKLRFVFIFAIAVLAASALFFVINSKYIFIGNNIIPKDSAEVKIDFMDCKIGRSLKRLEKIPEMEELRLCNASDDDSPVNIPALKNLKSLDIVCSEIDNLVFVNSFESLDNLHLVENEIDFQNFSNASIRSMQIWSCKITNFENIGKIPSLNELEIYQSNFGDDDKLIGNRFDSTILRDFDFITSLEIGGMEITDISGLLDMQSLRGLKVDSNCISDKQLAELLSAGINVETK